MPTMQTIHSVEALKWQPKHINPSMYSSQIMTNKLGSHTTFLFFFVFFLLIVQVFAISMAKEEKPKSTGFDEGWKILQEAFNNLISIAEGSISYRVTSEDHMSYYTIVYEACIANPIAASQFYNAYKTQFEDYISSKILPSLQQSREEDLVANFVKSWTNYKLVTRWFFRFMNYLDRYYIQKNNLLPLELTSYLCFYDKIYEELNDQIQDAILTMIRDERVGKQIDEKLLNDVQEMYNDMAKRSTKHAHYRNELEKSIYSDNMGFSSIQTLFKWMNAVPLDAHEHMLQLHLRECVEGDGGKRIVSSFMQEKKPSHDEYLLKIIEQGLQWNWSAQANRQTITFSSSATAWAI